jgi:hypothetical protein
MQTCPLFKPDRSHKVTVASTPYSGVTLTVKNFVQVRCVDEYSTYEKKSEKKKEWIDGHLAGLKHGLDKTRDSNFF